MDLLDVAALRRFKGQVLPLETQQHLTFGNPLRTRAFLEHLNPSKGIYTAVVEESGDILLIGQIARRGISSRAAHVTYMAPARAILSPQLEELVEHLAMQAGNWGAFHLLVDADEHAPSFDALRRTGFSVYAWQRVWRVDPGAAAGKMPQRVVPDSAWQAVGERDEIPVRSLAQSLVPALVQPVEPLFDRRPRGFVARSSNRTCGYAEVTSGTEGVWVLPFIHPETENLPGLLLALISQVQQKYGMQIYLCVRSYQAWIESALEDLPVLASPRQALMVRHLAIRQKVSSPVQIPGFEKPRVKPGPVAHTESGPQGHL